MAIPFGSYRSTGLQDGRLSFEKARTAAQGIAGGIIGSSLTHQAQGLSSISQNLLGLISQRNRIQGLPNIPLTGQSGDVIGMQQSRGYTGPTPAAGYQEPIQVAMRTGNLGEQYRARTLARIQFLNENGLDTSQLSAPQLRNVQFVPDDVIQRAVSSKNLGEIPGEPGSPTGEAPLPYTEPIGGVTLPEAASVVGTLGLGGAGESLVPRILGNARAVVGGEVAGRVTSAGLNAVGAPPAVAIPATVAASLAGSAVGYAAPDILANPRLRAAAQAIHAGEAGGTRYTPQEPGGPTPEELAFGTGAAGGRYSGLNDKELVSLYKSIGDNPPGQELFREVYRRELEGQLGLSPRSYVEDWLGKIDLTGEPRPQPISYEPGGGATLSHLTDEQLRWRYDFYQENPPVSPASAQEFRQIRDELTKRYGNLGPGTYPGPEEIPPLPTEAELAKMRPTEVPPIEQAVPQPPAGLREDLRKALTGETPPSNIPAPGSRGQYLGPALRRTYKSAGFTKDEINQIAAGEFPELLPRVSGAGGLAENTTELRRRLLAERGKGFFGRLPGPPTAEAAPAPEPLQPGTVPTTEGAEQAKLLPDIEKAFGTKLAGAAHNALGATWHEAVNLVGLQRVIRTILDVSWPLRQGIAVAVRHPKEVWGNIPKKGIATLFSNDVATEWDAATRAKPAIVNIEGRNVTIGDLQKEAGLFLPEPSGANVPLSERTEEFGAIAGRDSWVGKIFGPIAKPFERSFTVLGNATRSDIFENTVQGWLRNGKQVTDQDTEALAWLINVATGRGNLGAFNRHAATLAIPLFSPRLAAARVEHALSPVLLSTGVAGVPQSNLAARLAAEQLVTFIGTGLAILTVASKVGGVKVETNPLSSKWGKIEVGADRLDPLKLTHKIDLFGGYTPYASLIARLYNAKAMSDTGQIYPKDRIEIAKDFVSTKLSPTFTTVRDAVSGKYFSGEKVDLNTLTGARTFLWNEFSPLAFNDIVEAVKADNGFKPLTPALGAYSILGGGVTTYGSNPQTVANSFNRYQGISKDQEDALYKYQQEVAYEWNRAKRQGVDISQADIATILGQKTGRPELGAQATLAIQNKLPLNKDQIQFAVNHQDDLDAKTLLRLVPDEILRKYLTPKNFDRVFKQ